MQSQINSNLPEDPKTMNAVEVVQNNFNNWNRHDAKAIVAAFAEGGTYSNPNQDHPLAGEAIGDFARTVFTIFPDFSLDLISIGDTGGSLVALQWVYHGTNTGPFPDGTPATGRRVTLPGAAFVQVQGDKIRSEQVYIDRLAEQKQLGFIKD
jgi:steroid delta-isomerase-like uncharacterized protein